MARAARLGAWALAGFVLALPLFPVALSIAFRDFRALLSLPFYALFWAIPALVLCVFVILLAFVALALMRYFPVLDRSWPGIALCSALMAALSTAAQVLVLQQPSAFRIEPFYLAEAAALFVGLVLARRVFASFRPGAFTLRLP